MLEFMTKFRDPHAGQYDKQKLAFNLSVFHIAVNTGSTCAAQEEQNKAEATARQIINGDTSITFKSVPLSDLYAREESDPSLRQAKLTELLVSIKDSTGKADMVSYLRTTLLLKLCKELGCKNLVVGYNASAFAIRAVASAVKGAGYALPSDAQHVDARHALTGGAFIIYPMKDLTDEEIDVVCRVLGLPCKDIKEDNTKMTANGNVQALATTDIDKHDINALAALFVDNVLKHNPGAVHNINSTISKLEAFSWNELSSNEKKERKDLQEVVETVVEEEEVFCPLCCAPLAEDEIAAIITGGIEGKIAGVCDSCRHQIFAAANDGGDVLTKLPRCVVDSIDQTAATWTYMALHPEEIGLTEAELRQIKAEYPC
jgi:tRNA(Ile)-lysidine synthase TilS/MesJ